MLAPDTVLQDRYHIIDQLGLDGVGAVYLAQDIHLGDRQVVIKELPHNRFGSTPFQAQAQRELQLEAYMLAALDQPSLPKVYDYFIKEGNHYVVEDYVDGRTLEDIMNQTTGFLPESQVLNWAMQLCDVLIYLHSKHLQAGFLDLNPGNITVDQNDVIKLTDYLDIARFFRWDNRTDRWHMVSPGYAPPELYTAKGQFDVRSDIYSLGATMYHLLTRQSPADSTTITLTNPLVTPRSLNPGLSEYAEWITLKAMALKPDQRYQSVQEMKQVLWGAMPPTRPKVAVGPGAPARSLPRLEIVYQLRNQMVTVGSETGNDIVLSHPSVSPRHAELRQEAGRWVVHDLDSAQGTFVSYSGDPAQERRISTNALKNGSSVCFGQVAFVFRTE